MPGVVRVAPEQRFWSKVEVRGPDDCWWWTAQSRMPAGYGVFSIVRDGRKRHVGAHRYAYELTYGPIPAGLLICHHCDNPPCCNPAHLFAGTYADNNWDKTAKGRNPGNRTDRGRKQFALQGSDLQTALVMLRDGCTQRAIAERFGVSPAAVCRVLKVVRGAP